MKQLEVKKTITYRWWRAARTQEVRKAHIDELRQIAEAHITAQTQQGFTSGQLLHMTRLRGITYQGYWEVSEA